MRVSCKPISYKDGKTDLTFGVRCPHKHAPQDIVSAPAMWMHPQAGRVHDYVHAAFSTTDYVATRPEK